MALALALSLNLRTGKSQTGPSIGWIRRPYNTLSMSLVTLDERSLGEKKFTNAVFPAVLSQVHVQFLQDLQVVTSCLLSFEIID